MDPVSLGAIAAFVTALAEAIIAFAALIEAARRLSRTVDGARRGHHAAPAGRRGGPAWLRAVLAGSRRLFRALIPAPGRHVEARLAALPAG